MPLSSLSPSESVMITPLKVVWISQLPLVQVSLDKTLIIFPLVTNTSPPPIRQTDQGTEFEDGGTERIHAR